ncbi:sensor histidine kinase [Paractinoplanes atraurantiacus]|uniref:Anti-sigma regulatory factor (Ser/Thr protein kinase) n=1 Tax=Paractinoplanes atraurantiacus TaxID=1036182 RepID=A0A285GKV8_9ACTN|nr:sensor histidine kinase [Actinoplanes atraurantiacus]SNY24260.1 Anti-sigma regulatory factor (Ser/Thr protein kinase) [Actinoplanes atraurantiacus]
MSRPADADRFRHTALVLDGARTVDTALVPHLRRLLRAGEPVFMVVGDHTATAVRRSLGAAGGALEWGDSTGFYQRLGFAYEGFRRHLAAEHANGRHVHVIAEPDLTGGAGDTTSTSRAAEYLAYESICNDTYAPYGSPVTCVWDSRRHPPDLIDEVREVHGHELTEDGPVPSRTYRPPGEYLAGRDEVSLDDVPGNAQDLRLGDAAELGRLRAALRSSISRAPFTGEAADDIVVAATEAASNGLVHGAAPVRVRFWHHGDTFVVQADDAGGYPLPPDAGYRPPEPAAGPGGRGLWLARQLADTVSTHARPGCTSVRMHFPLEITNRNPA